MLLAVLTVFVSCNGSKSVSTAASANVNGEPDEDQVQVIKAPLKIAGEDIEKYRIVYARCEYYEVGRTLTTEYDFYKLTAEDIAEQIYTITGKTLQMSRDTETPEGKYEILVGPTNRSQSDIYDGMDVYTYRNYVKGTKLVIGAGYNSSHLTADRKTNYCWAATYHAFDFVKDHIASAVQNGSTEVDLAEGLDLTGKCELTTVACIGDSITEGAQASNREITSWPSVLQRILWKDYVIANLGYSTKTMRSDLSAKYKDTVCYNALSEYGESFDIAMIMLGTNDSYADPNFSASEDKIFKDSALDIVKQMTRKNKDLKITIMNCPVYYGTGYSGSLHVRNLQANLVTELADKGYDTTFFDMHTFTSENLGKACFPDDLHPNDKGYSIIAKRMSEVIPAILQDKWDINKQEVITD